MGVTRFTSSRLRLLLPALALLVGGCATHKSYDDGVDRSTVPMRSNRPVEPDLNPVIPGMGGPRSAAPEPAALPADTAIAAALSITPPLIAYDDGPGVDLDRAARQPAAFAGYVEPAETGVFVYTVDRIGGYGQVGTLGGGAFNRYERRSTSFTARVGVR